MQPFQALRASTRTSPTSSNAAIGLGALPASLLFGALWQWSGPVTAFGCGAVLAALAAVLLLGLVRVGERRA